MVCTIDAAGTCVGERVEHWRHAIREHLGVDAGFHPLGDDEFAQSMSIARFGGVLVGERHGSPFQALQTANDSGLVIACLTVSGHCEFKWGGKVRPAGPGSLTVFPLREAVSSLFTSSTHHHFIACPSALLSAQCSDWQTRGRSSLGSNSAPVHMLFDLVHTLLRNAPTLGPNCRKAGGDLLTSLLATSLAETDEDMDDRASHIQSFHKQRIRNFVSTRLDDPQLDASSIAAGVGLSLRYVHRLFADEPLHLMQWVLEQRLLRCYDALRTPAPGSESISQIAYRWGFNDAAHFSRAFRKRFGLSPREVVEQARRSLN